MHLCPGKGKMDIDLKQPVTGTVNGATGWGGGRSGELRNVWRGSTSLTVINHSFLVFGWDPPTAGSNCRESSQQGPVQATVMPVTILLFVSGPYAQLQKDRFP